VLDGAYPAFMDLDWFRAIFLDANPKVRLAYPHRGDTRYQVLSRDDVVRLVAGFRPLLNDSAAAAREAAEGIARLVPKAVSAENITLAHTSLL
jgi:hypothetical protein